MLSLVCPEFLKMRFGLPEQVISQNLEPCRRCGHIAFLDVILNYFWKTCYLYRTKFRG